MTDEDASKPPDTEFPRTIGRVASRELARSGYARFDQLTGVTPKALLAIHGVGPKAVRILGEELKSRGLTFAGDDGSPRNGGPKPGQDPTRL